MKNKMRNIDIIEHVLKYCNQSQEVLDACSSDYEQFNNNSIYINAVAMCVLQIGELAKRLTVDFREENSEIPWSLICRNRDKFAHDYGTVDPKELWKTAEEDIPVLKVFCEKILKYEKLFEQEALSVKE